MHTVCVCKQCLGLNHGRMAYFERLERNKPENVFRANIKRLMDAVDTWDENSEDYRAGRVLAGMMERHELAAKDVGQFAEWCQVPLSDTQKFISNLEANGVLYEGKVGFSCDFDKIGNGDQNECNCFVVEFILLTLVAKGDVVRVPSENAA